MTARRHDGEPFHRHRSPSRYGSSVRITTGNLKGGVGKTTTALYLTHGLARRGRTLLVDADPKGSLPELAERVGEDFPATVVKITSRDLGRQVTGLAASFDHVVIDTGPENETLLRQALGVSDVLVIPCAPSLFDVDRLGVTLELVDAARDFHPGIEARVLLTHVRPGRNASDARAGLTNQGHPLFDAQVRLLNEFQEAFSVAPTTLGDYEAVLDELVRRYDGVTA